MSLEDRIRPVLMTAEKHAGDVDREGRFPAETVGSLRQSGLLGLTLPTTVGGLGATPTDFLSVTRSLASRCASSAMV